MGTDLRIAPHMSYGQMRRYCDSLGVTVCSDRLREHEQGRYVHDLNVIVIDRYQTYRVKRCALAHELVHWSHGDDSCSGVTGARLEHRARRETAMLLLSPVEYASAERIYEGDVALIAEELDVTMQVVRDFQKLVVGV